MAFWNSEKIKEKVGKEKIIVPYKEEQVKHAAYELMLGPEAFVTDTSTGTKQILHLNKHLVISPGQFGLLLTDETVNIPNDTISFISIRASIKFKGLVNVSGFHVDPGFKGRLKFSVYNAGGKNIVLDRTEPVFLIWFSDLEPTADLYAGKHNNQQEITADDVMRIQGEVSSPAALKLQIDELRREIRVLVQSLGRRRAFWVTVWSAVIAAIVVLQWPFKLQIISTAPIASEISQPKQQIELKKDTSQSGTKTKPVHKE
jgi:dCTP deaminase